jgi:hypothetical protein
MRRRIGILIAAFVLGAVVMVYVLVPAARLVPRHGGADTRLRGLFTGLVAYSQAHPGAVPRPAQLRQELVSGGYVGSEVFELSTGEPALYVVGDYSTIGAGSDRFVPTIPVFSTNPRANEAWVIFSDNHVDMLANDALRNFADSYGGSAQPIR